MINAALKVFALNGYQHASTDDMVAEAGISKGLLFHYFVNKLGLYTFLYDYSVRFMLLELNGCSGTESDFFELVGRMETAKLKVLKNYPYMQEFLNSIRYENVKEAVLATEEKKHILETARKEILEHADVSKFRSGVDVEKVKKIIDYTINGMLKESFYENTFQPDYIQEEINDYLLLMKKMSYE